MRGSVRNIDVQTAYTLNVAGQTDTGQVRALNEDNLGLNRSEQLFVVADGMGGEAAGEVASALSVEALTEFFRVTGEDTDVTWPFKTDEYADLPTSRLVTGVRLANQRVFESSQKASQHRGMGTTLVALHIDGEQAYVAHVGDSRVYRLRAGELTQLTRDHSLLEQLKSLRPNMSQAEIDAFPYKHVIVRALGKEEDVEVDVWMGGVEAGDVFLLCSDGLSGMITDAQISEILSAHNEPEAACDMLVEAANTAGGKDNITTVVVRVEEA
ncbi:MAG: Stp1/IreP family PP2C-type Ser/Thr phosphatase [Bradymonadia bacterium]